MMIFLNVQPLTYCFSSQECLFEVLLFEVWLLNLLPTFKVLHCFSVDSATKSANSSLTGHSHSNAGMADTEPSSNSNIYSKNSSYTYSNNSSSTYSNRSTSHSSSEPSSSKKASSITCQAGTGNVKPVNVNKDDGVLMVQEETSPLAPDVITKKERRRQGITHSGSSTVRWILINIVVPSVFSHYFGLLLKSINAGNHQLIWVLWARRTHFFAPIE